MKTQSLKLNNSLYLEKILKTFIRIVKAVFRRIYTVVSQITLNNERYYYANLYSNHSFFHLLIKNIADPSRIAKKFFYGQIIPLPQRINKAIPWKPVEDSLSQEAKEVANELKENGIVVIPRNYKDKISAWKLPDYKKEVTPSVNYELQWLTNVDNSFLEFLADPFLIKILGYYYGCRPYLRYPPTLRHACPSMNTHEIRNWLNLSKGNSSEFANYFEFDTPNLTTFHVLLSQVTSVDSRFLVAKKSHKYHHISISPHDRYYSDEYVFDHFEVTEVCGEEGTLVLFDNNILHRQEAVEKSQRTVIHYNFIPGNDIRPEVLKSYNLKIKQFPDNFTADQKEVFKYVNSSNFENTL